MSNIMTSNPLSDYDFNEMRKFIPIIDTLKGMDRVLNSVQIKEVTEANVPYEGAVVGEEYFEFKFENSTDIIYLPLNEADIPEYIFGEGLKTEGQNISVDFEKVADKTSVDTLTSELATLNENTANSINTLNQNMTDGFNTINEGIDNEIRPAISGNTEEIKKTNEVIAGIVLEQTIDNPLKYTLKVNGESRGTIDIPKDQFLKTASFDNETSMLTLVFETSEGEVSTQIDMSELKDVYTPGDGIDISDNTVKIKINPATENYLKCTADGLEVSGIDAQFTTTNEKITVVEGKADKNTEDIVSVNEKITTVEGKADAVNTRIDDEVNPAIAEAKAKADNSVQWVPLPGVEDRPDRKCITLGNHDVILGYSEVDQDNCSLIMLSKWDKVDVGSAKKAINLNTPTGVRPTIQEAHQSGENANQMAYLSDIPNHIGKYVNGNKLFALTTASTSEEVKAALSYKPLNGVGEGTVITEDDLNKCLKYGLYFKDILEQPVLVGWTGSAWLFTEVSMISPKSDIYVSTVAVTVNGDTYACVKNGKREKMVSDLSGVENQISLLEQRISNLMSTASNVMRGEDGTGYDSISEAIAGGAKKVYLSKNIEGDIDLTASLEKSLNQFEIVGNGATLTGRIKNVISDSDFTLTVKDLVMQSPTGDTQHYGIISQDQTNPDVSKFNLVLEDVTFKGYNHKGLYITNAGNVTIKRCKFIDNCGESDYVADFNLCGVQDAQITFEDCEFSGAMGGTSAIKITQRGGENDYAKDINTGVWKWDAEQSKFVENPGGKAATITNVTIKNCKFNGRTDRKADITIGSSPNEDGSTRTSCGNYPYSVNNGGLSKVWKRFEGEETFVNL